MSSGEILILGAIAGLTIFIGLPVGRSESLRTSWRVFLNAIAIGILIFLLWDVLAEGNERVEDALTAAKDGGGSWLRFVGLGMVFAAGAAVGLLSMVYYDRWLGRQRGAQSLGPGAAAVTEFETSRSWDLSSARRLALFIAIGIGLHNFSEGLAIGQSAAADEINLALALIIGFGLHNATEGFGIVAPLASEQVRPSWGFLGLLGLIGGGPTFLGTVIGQSWVNDTLFLAFMALAAGSILYVVIQLVQVGGRMRHPQYMAWGIFLGLVAGFSTDYVLVAAGA